MCILCVWCLNDCQDGFNHKLSIQCWYPLIIDCLRADLTCIGFNIWMIDFSDEVDLWRLEWVALGEVKMDHKLSTNEGCSFWAVDHDIPLSDIRVRWLNLDSIYWVLCQISKFLNETNGRDELL